MKIRVLILIPPLREGCFYGITGPRAEASWPPCRNAAGVLVSYVRRQGPPEADRADEMESRARSIREEHAKEDRLE